VALEGFLTSTNCCLQVNGNTFRLETVLEGIHKGEQIAIYRSSACVDYISEQIKL